MTKRSYCIISPVLNESLFARRALDSVLAQSELPDRWIIVDDGSTDETPRILADYAARYDCITIVTRESQHGRRVGAGVIEAFKEGLKVIELKDYDFICKLDLDLALPQNYFQCLMDRMDDDPRLGTCSGKAYYRGPLGQVIMEDCGDENSIGASKFYRRQCFEEIGGFESRLMWDGIDCHRARMLGWKVGSWNEPSLLFEHLRPMGSSHKSIWNGRKRHGQGQYAMGTGPIYFVASAIYRIGSRPRLIGSLAMLWGYFSAALRGVPRHEDREFVRFLRRYQWRALLSGKKMSAKQDTDAAESDWFTRHGRRIDSGHCVNALRGHTKELEAFGQQVNINGGRSA